MNRQSPTDRLRALGASPSETEELLSYDQPFPAPDPILKTVPLPDEPFVATWQAWAEESEHRGAAALLRRHLPQLAFPIRQGISQSESYRAATLAGTAVDELGDATGLELERPESLELHLYPSFAGTVPLLIARHRADFVRLLQALAKRNEPLPVPPAQGAVTIAGYNNWARIRALQKAWHDQDPARRSTSTWGEEFARIRTDKTLYQFILIVFR